MITDLPPLNRHNSIMVVVDHGLMKGVILTPCSKTINVAGVAKLFLHHVFIQFRLHDFLISDRGPQFASAFARELAWLLHYDVNLSTVYHPQTDGQTERTNQEVEMHLRIFCTNNLGNGRTSFPPPSFITIQSLTAPPKSPLFPYSMNTNPKHICPWGKMFIPALENWLNAHEEAQKEALAAHETSHCIMREWNMTICPSSQPMKTPSPLDQLISLDSGTHTLPTWVPLMMQPPLGPHQHTFLLLQGIQDLAPYISKLISSGDIKFLCDATTDVCGGEITPYMV